MTCKAATLESLEVRFAFAGWLGSKIRQRKSRLVIVSGLFIVAGLTRYAFGRLRNGTYFEKFSPEQAAKACERLSDLCQRMNAIAEVNKRIPIDRTAMGRMALRVFRNNLEDLEDILESWHLSLNADFRTLVEDSVEELNLQTPTERGSSVATVRD